MGSPASPGHREPHLFTGPGIDQCPNPACGSVDVVAVGGGSAGEMECRECRARFWVGEGTAYMPAMELGE